MLAKAFAKINFYLHVTGKRPDGYHLLDSLMAPVDLHDVIEISSSSEISLNVEGEFASLSGNIEDNIILKAARLLSEKANVKHGVAIKLQKNIPAGAGLGGGSADAATILKMLNKFWQINYDDDILAQIGLQLGADVPFCLFGKAAFMSGIGEIIKDAPALPSMNILLVNPRIILNTANVFRYKPFSFKDMAIAPDKFNNLDDFIKFLETTRNCLQANAIEMVPQIADILAEINRQDGVLLARMSGSGATCFGIFVTQEQKVHAMINIRQNHPEWYLA